MRKVENALSKQGHDCKKPETVGQWILCHFLLLVGLGLALLFYVLNPNVFSSFGITSILSTASIQGIIALGLMMELTTGNFDLSIGATAGFSAAVLAQLWPTLAQTGIFRQYLLHLQRPCLWDCLTPLSQLELGYRHLSEPWLSDRC